MDKVIVIGGGPAGLMAANSAVDNANEVVLIEKNEKLGKKLYITGKGRCNLSNATDVECFLKNVVTNNRFLYAGLSKFSPLDAIVFFTSGGLKLKTERGNRVFPESDKASDVTKFFEKKLTNKNVDILLNTTVLSIAVKNNVVCGVETNKGFIAGKSVIIATGGISYPLTGSTGDGYKFAESLGHKIIKPKPALVGIETACVYPEMQGLSLKNVVLRADDGKKTFFNELGEMLFTHYGISGPIVLSCSSYLNRLDLSKINLYIDLKPALEYSVIDKRLMREFKDNNRKSLSSVLGLLIPKSLVKPFISVAKLNENKICAEITNEERKRIIETLKKFPLNPLKLRPIDEAIITSGGVNVKEINPKTMESKLVKNLFFAGEVIDVDALTGGFNIQIALSTGNLAGLNA